MVVMPSFVDWRTCSCCYKFDRLYNPNWRQLLNGLCIWGCLCPLLSILFRPLSSRRRNGQLPFTPVIKDPPSLACDHAHGIINGHDRPHMLDDVHHA